MELNSIQLDKLKDIVARYKKYIREKGGRNEDEIYKFRLIKNFQEKWNLDAENLVEMIKGIQFQNLIYHMSRSVLLHIAGERTDFLRESFKKLFNDNIELQQRVETFQEEIRIVYCEITDVKWHNKDRQEERAIATYLTFHNPNKYSLYKSSFVTKLWKLLDIKSAPTGQRYNQYMDFIYQFVDKVIMPDAELLQLEDDYLTEDCIKDEKRLILAQDILYQILDKNISIKEPRYWRIGTTDGTPNASTSFWEEMKKGSFVSIGWPELGDISKLVYKNRPEFIEIFKKKCSYMKEKTAQVISRKAGEILNFYNSIQIGDYVISCEGQTVLGIGEVLEEYSYDGKYEFAHQRKVNWLDDQVKELYIGSGPLTTVYEITDKTEVEMIKNYLINPVSNVKEDEKTNEIKSLNSIFYGPPGTGKTYEVCKILKKSQNVSFVTFHQTYSYEEFIEGIKPVMNNSNKGQLSYAIEEGVFYKICKDALKSVLNLDDEETEDNIFDYYEGLKPSEKINLFDAAPKFYFIIDEINRGNVSSIFGELITLIESNKRLGNKEELLVTLPYSRKKFGIPANLYIIGTMNTADRSVEALDTALRRRFSFTEMEPKPELLSNDMQGINLSEVLDTINKRIEVLLDRDHLIGHSYFMNIESLEDLRMSFAKNIIPLLQEYFYGDYGKIALVLGEGFCRVDTPKIDKSFFALGSDTNAISNYSDKKNYRIHIPEQDSDLKNAIKSLLNPPNTDENANKN